MIYKYCQRCGKRLKGDENRLRGYGKTCFEKAQKEAEGLTPLLSPTAEQVQRQLNRLTAEEQRARAEAEQRDRARARLEAEQAREQSREQERQRAEQSKSENLLRKNFETRETPHLEKTLNPTFKKPLLFMPPNRPPTPAI